MRTFDPPPSVGDPAGITALAASISRLADQLRAGSAQVGMTLESMTFGGPLRDRTSAHIATIAAGVSQQASTLDGLAADLRATAARISAEQARVNAEWERAREKAMQDRPAR